MSDVTGAVHASFVFSPDTAGAKTTFSGFASTLLFASETVGRTNALTLSVDSPGTLSLSADTPGGFDD